MIHTSPAPEVVGQFDTQKAVDLATRLMRPQVFEDFQTRFEQRVEDLNGSDADAIFEMIGFTMTKPIIETPKRNRILIQNLNDPQQRRAMYYHIDSRRKGTIGLPFGSFPLLFGVTAHSPEYVVGEINFASAIEALGDYHEVAVRTELYLPSVCLEFSEVGQKCVSVAIRGGTAEVVTFEPGSVVYVPEGNAHRSAPLGEARPIDLPRLALEQYFS